MTIIKNCLNNVLLFSSFFVCLISPFFFLGEDGPVLKLTSFFGVHFQTLFSLRRPSSFASLGEGALRLWSKGVTLHACQGPQHHHQMWLLEPSLLRINIHTMWLPWIYSACLFCLFRWELNTLGTGGCRFNRCMFGPGLLSSLGKFPLHILQLQWVWHSYLIEMKGEVHRKQRKMLNPVFSITHLREMGALHIHLSITFFHESDGCVTVPIFYPIVYKVPILNLAQTKIF